MNLTYSTPNRVHPAMTWLLSAMLMLSALFLASHPVVIAAHPANAVHTAAVSASQPVPQVSPVPVPSQAAYRPAQTPQLSATPVPPAARPAPAVQPAATPRVDR